LDARGVPANSCTGGRKVGENRRLSNPGGVSLGTALQ
jgi:hypothetical protein